MLRYLLLLAALLALPGCLVIEKKTLILVVPPDSKEARLHYRFEGISSLDHPEGSLDGAKADLTALQQDDLRFFVPGNLRADHPLRKHLRFGKLSFTTDPARTRPLCASREVTITDRGAFAAALNELLSEQLRQYPADDRVQHITKAKADRGVANLLAEADKFGVGALARAAFAVTALAEKFDKPSFEAIAAAVGKNAYPWLTFEPDGLRLTFPITADCARKIVADPAAPDWLKEIRAVVEPAELAASDKGLSMVLGAKGKPIRFTHADPRPHRPGHEAALARHAGRQTGDVQLDRLVGELTSSYRAVRCRAADSLGALGTAAKAALPALRDALGDISEDVQAAARAAIKKIDP